MRIPSMRVSSQRILAPDFWTRLRITLTMCIWWPRTDSTVNPVRYLFKKTYLWEDGSEQYTLRVCSSCNQASTLSVTKNPRHAEFRTVQWYVTKPTSKPRGTDTSKTDTPSNYASS